jgi:hypothetical protein
MAPRGLYEGWYCSEAKALLLSIKIRNVEARM